MEKGRGEKCEGVGVGRGVKGGVQGGWGRGERGGKKKNCPKVLAFYQSKRRKKGSEDRREGGNKERNS